MKHIKKFNESYESPDEVVELINDVFRELSDNSSMYASYDEGEYFISLDVLTMFENSEEISADNYTISSDDSLERFIKYHNYMLNFFKEMEICIERLKNYIDIERYTVDHYDGEFVNGKIVSYINISIQV
jgi:hypothetical protein